VFQDLRLLYQHAMIDLRLAGPSPATDPGRLHALERRSGGLGTTAAHTRVALV
jgi:hypothetical protein